MGGSGLLNFSSHDLVGRQAERELKVKVEAIEKVRHKNLVGVVDYYAKGSQRMLMYAYVDNGNQWLHGEAGSVSPLGDSFENCYQNR